jgi:hypothetical protein
MSISVVKVRILILIKWSYMSLPIMLIIESKLANKCLAYMPIKTCDHLTVIALFIFISLKWMQSCYKPTYLGGK